MAQIAPKLGETNDPPWTSDRSAIRFDCVRKHASAIAAAG